MLKGGGWETRIGPENLQRWGCLPTGKRVVTSLGALVEPGIAMRSVPNHLIAEAGSEVLGHRIAPASGPTSAGTQLAVSGGVDSAPAGALPSP